jgi:hypothetical protein
MTRYVIAMTITPDPPTAAPASELTVRVDTSSGSPRVNELVVRSEDDRGLASAGLPAIDFGLLIQALSGGIAAGSSAAGRPGGARGRRLGATPAAAGSSAAVGKAAPGKAAGGKAAGGKAAGGKAAAGKVAAGKAAGKKTSRTRRLVSSGGRRAAAGTGAAATATERAYRRMPDAAEVLAAYQRLGTITELARHYGVPRHTAQGWASRLRRSGYQIGRS